MQFPLKPSVTNYCDAWGTSRGLLGCWEVSDSRDWCTTDDLIIVKILWGLFVMTCISTFLMRLNGHPSSRQPCSFLETICKLHFLTQFSTDFGQQGLKWLYSAEWIKLYVIQFFFKFHLRSIFDEILYETSLFNS